MRLQSVVSGVCGARAPARAEFVAAALLLAATCMGAGPVSAQDDGDVAYVEGISGRVVAMAEGKPTLLDALDVIGDRTRLDLQANSELRICHYPTRQLLTLKGPLRASISRDGVTAENSKTAVASAGTCAAPVVSTFQGGVVSRGTSAAGAAGVKTANMNVTLRPSIRIVNRGPQSIQKVLLLDGDSHEVLMVFERNIARPNLAEGQSYVLVVERNDGSEFKMTLQASAVAQTDPLIVVVR
jgi:hypothetical protein